MERWAVWMPGTDGQWDEPCGVRLVRAIEGPGPWKNDAVVQLLSRVQLFATPRTAACQAPLSFTVSQSLLKIMSIELVVLLGTNGATLWLWSCLPKPGAPGP